MKTSIKIGVIAACMSAASLFAADISKDGSLSHTDKSFVEKAAKSGMTEERLPDPVEPGDATPETEDPPPPPMHP